MYFDNYIFFNAFKFLLCKINKLSMILVSWMAKSHTRQLYTPWIRRDIFGLKKKYRNFQLVIDRYDRYDFFMFRLSFFLLQIFKLVLQDVVLLSIEPPNDVFFIEKYRGRIYLRRSPSENPAVSEYYVC